MQHVRGVFDCLTFRIRVNPPCVAKCAIERILKHFFSGGVRFILLVIHDNCDIAERSTSSIPSRSVVLVLCHRGVGTQSRVRGAPGNVPRWLD